MARKVRCSICKKKKDYRCFSKVEAKYKGGRCRKCKSKYNRHNELTKPDHFVLRLYKAQRAHCKYKKRPMPTYNLKELREFCLVKHKDKFLKLFKEYRESDFVSELAPSIDRINPLRGYELDNIQVMTWGENHKKSFEVDRKIIFENDDEDYWNQENKKVNLDDVPF